MTVSFNFAKRYLAIGTGVATGVLVFVCIATAVLFLARMNQSSRFELLREHTRNLAIIAAQMVDGDLHNKIRSPEQMGGPDYSRAVEPLVRLHNALPELFYVYTIIDENRRTYFILDTAADPRLRSERKLQPSDVMEELSEDPEGDLEWLDKLKTQNSYVSPDF